MASRYRHHRECVPQLSQQATCYGLTTNVGSHEGLFVALLAEAVEIH